MRRVQLEDWASEQSLRIRGKTCCQQSCAQSAHRIFQIDAHAVGARVQRSCIVRCSQAYLGHVVDHSGLHTDPRKTAPIADWPEPTSILHGISKLLRQICTTICRDRRPDKTGSKFQMTDEARSAFATLIHVASKSHHLVMNTFPATMGWKPGQSARINKRVVVQHFFWRNKKWWGQDHESSFLLYSESDRFCHFQDWQCNVSTNV